MPRTIGIAIKRASNSMQRFTEHQAKKLGLTGVQMSIIDFISREENQRDIFQLDVEQEFNIQKSSATALLKLMEKRELIVRVAAPKDNRFKRIILTPKTRELLPQIKKIYAEDDQILHEILDQDYQTTLNSLNTIIQFFNAKMRK
ncbi:MarR family transcriptional regulator [Lactobacillus sp. CC-MHH1034]|uniref:MarR family winged helix-turn-helix transcriptional regulator n=1 Tax=Agrilactobacillus fermenti TaxID=2586909 RepID=UPI001E4384B3|nr:MarR family transcriptional regulator [Agrilactobacillus fermenti]MCD2255666.1 MarR family transcriptional regulator [Agrilactobacillus fermenti]